MKPFILTLLLVLTASQGIASAYFDYNDVQRQSNYQQEQRNEQFQRQQDMQRQQQYEQQERRQEMQFEQQQRQMENNHFGL